MDPARPLALFLVPTLLLLAGCTGLGGGPSVVNNLNQFSISWKVDSHTESKPYSWSNDKAFARITFSSTITAGTLEFAMLDNAATSVCAITFGTASTASGDAVTKAPGQPGRWTIRFNLRGMSGTVAASIVAVDSASGGSTTAGGPSCT